MNFFLRLFILLIFAGAVRAQQGPDTLWTRSYPWVPLSEVYTATSGATDIRADGDGFLITCPISNGLPDDRVDERYYFKINASGDTLWSQHCSGLDPQAFPRCVESGYGEARKALQRLSTWNGPSADPENAPSRSRMQHIVRASDGGWILGGTTTPSFKKGADLFTCSYITKLDSSGAERWTREFGCDKKPHPDSLRGSVPTETPRRKLVDPKKAETVQKASKMPASANKMNQQLYQVTDLAVVRATDDGGCVVCGETSNQSLYKGTDAYVVRYSANGDTLWTWTGGENRRNRCDDLLLLPDGGCVLLSYPDWMTRLASDGTQMWSKAIRLLSSRDYTRMTPAKGGFLITGISDDGQGWKKMNVLKISDSGELIWHGEYQSPGTSMSMCNAAIETAEGGYLLAGLWNGKVGIIRLAPDPGK
jgi:hypothetical protein